MLLDPVTQGAKADLQECRSLYLRVVGPLKGQADHLLFKAGHGLFEAQVQKIPYMLIIGDKEMEAGQVTVRLRDGENLPAMKVADFAEVVRNQCEGEKKLAD